jgi:hypothetical protein
MRRGVDWRRTAVLALCACLWGAWSLHPVQAGTADAAPASQLRCGWWENPTPSNAWLNDRDGSWTVGSQGGHQAEGDWPSFSDAQWVRTNGYYGYGCACLRVVADARSQRVERILSARARPLAACRQDRRLREPLRPGERRRALGHICPRPHASRYDGCRVCRQAHFECAVRPPTVVPAGVIP